jgi:hypothetical protein
MKRVVTVKACVRRRSIRAIALFAGLLHADERGWLSKRDEALGDLARLGIEVRLSPRHTNLVRKGVSHG